MNPIRIAPGPPTKSIGNRLMEKRLSARRRRVIVSECYACYEQATTDCDGFAFCQRCCEEHMKRMKEDCPSTTVTVPREEWERMRADAWRLKQISQAATEAWSMYKSKHIDHQRYLELVSNAVDQHTPYDDESTPGGEDKS